MYESERVGGENTTGGLHEATNALEDFFFLDTLKSGQRGKIILQIGLDGETLGNSYQDTLADLQMDFAVGNLRAQETIEAHGHTYSHMWHWTDNYKQAVLSLKCEDCNFSKDIPATVTSKNDGNTVLYTASADFEGKQYTESQKAGLFTIKVPYGGNILEYQITKPLIEKTDMMIVGYDEQGKMIDCQVIRVSSMMNAITTSADAPHWKVLFALPGAFVPVWGVQEIQ